MVLIHCLSGIEDPLRRSTAPGSDMIVQSPEVDVPEAYNRPSFHLAILD